MSNVESSGNDAAASAAESGLLQAGQGRGDTDTAAMVTEAAYADSTLDDEAKLVVVAALESDAALRDLVGGQQPAAAGSDQQGRPEPTGAYLASIQVRSFRGIGEEAELKIKPGPGLTIVAGRNGSGKSSFSEALEVALTATTHRWDNKGSTQWAESWRNLHTREVAPRIRVVLNEEGVGKTVVEVGWPGEEGARAIERVLRRRDGRKEPFDVLGWHTGILEAHRPILSYDELGEVLTSAPSALYDALSVVLGLGTIAEAIERLTRYVRELDEPVKRLRASKKALLAELESCPDERAARARKLLRQRNPAYDELLALATGSASMDPAVGHLEAALRLSIPTGEEVMAVAERLRAAVGALADAGGRSVEALEKRQAVLEAAITLHEHSGDQPCPVCADGRLDGTRVTALHGEVDRSRGALAELRAARKSLDDACRVARALVRPVPVAVLEALEEPLATTADTLRQAWQTWADGPPEPVGLAAHLEGHFDAVDVALADLRSAVTAELDRHDAAWRAVAGTLAGYAAQAKKCGGLAPRRNAARAALTWLKQEDNHLKNQRLRPIADEAKAIWAALRQESNVDIAGITLEGTSTRRHVEIAASIDGTDAPGVTVLSQGELHALALALFLPRATMPSSPFRFIVLDDPVQAMDPAKVDGLLDVLTQLARNRQVVVFSHDDRLATAARHASSDATIVKVTREEGSRVHVSGESDPAQRYLMDAWALIKDEGIDEPTTRRILPGILRLAVEAAARDRFFTHLYATGTSRADVEQAWESARKTSAKVALTVYGEARHDLTPWLNKRSYRRRALGICTSGMHHGAAGDLVSAHRDVKDLVADIARTS